MAWTSLPPALWRPRTCWCWAPSSGDVIRENEDAKNFRVFGPDESKSNRLTPMFEATNRVWEAESAPGDEFLAHQGRVMDSMLSEHMCEGLAGGVPPHRPPRLLQQL